MSMDDWERIRRIDGPDHEGLLAELASARDEARVFAADLSAEELAWEIRENGGVYLEVRLQVIPGDGWILRTGSPDFDQDHCGYWGAGSVAPDESDADLEVLAEDLIGQVIDMWEEEHEDA